ncbi:MAG: hypothetical protein R3181_11385 [Rubricoccaceae bacterium]|nr:hypothetical protein [Rubricoccaceae bacterium]
MRPSALLPLLGALLLGTGTAASPFPSATAATPGSSTTAPADTTRPEVYLLPRFQPAALWSASRGFGIGGGLGIRNLGWAGSEIEVGARLSQRFQSASVYLYTGNPYTTPLYGLVGARVRTSSRQRYYGLGPTSDRDDRLNLDFASGQIEGRVGWYPLGHTGLLLQPGARLLYDKLSDFEDADDDPASLPDTTLLSRLEGDARYGVSVGLEVGHDTRDRLVMTRRGALVEASLRRFYALDGTDLRFNSAQVRVFGFQPLMGRRIVLFGRAVAAVTRADDEIDNTRLPFFYRPALDDALLPGYTGERFFGNDLVAVGAGLRFPLVDLFGRYAIDGLLMADVGSSYDDVADQFKFAVSFDEDVVADAEGRVPLRPSLGVGFNLVNIDRDRAVVGALLGFSPEGFVLGGLQIVYDFRDLLPLFR